MTFSSGFATTFPSAKWEMLILNSSSSSSSSSSLRACFPSQQMKPFCKFNSDRRNLVQKGVVRCEVAQSDVALESKKIEPSEAATISALEQLKTSAIDHKISLHSSSL